MAELQSFCKNLRKEIMPTTSVVVAPNTTVSTVAEADDGEARKVALGSNDVRPSGLDIKEPEVANDTGFGRGMKEYMAAVLQRYTQRWSERTNHNLGYQLNLEYDYDSLGELLKYSLNNCGDPFIEGNYGIHSRDFEIGVLDWFAHLWEINKDEYWGYITNGGTEGNLHGLLLGLVYPNSLFFPFFGVCNN
ncbi:Serine decarboxylase [Bienertia sinuspersici]